jgi:hypothetical protein
MILYLSLHQAFMRTACERRAIGRRDASGTSNVEEAYMKGLRLIRLTLAAAVIGAAFAVLPAGTASAAVQLCDRTLEYGDSGDCVARLQRRLNELGLDCGNGLAADGCLVG